MQQQNLLFTSLHIFLYIGRHFTTQKFVSATAVYTYIIKSVYANAKMLSNFDFMRFYRICYSSVCTYYFYLYSSVCTYFAFVFVTLHIFCIIIFVRIRHFAHIYIFKSPLSMAAIFLLSFSFCDCFFTISFIANNFFFNLSSV